MTESDPLRTTSMSMGLDDVVVDPERARRSIIDRSLRPYHLYYEQDMEGEAVNPEAAQRNFDILLVTSDMIQYRHVTKNDDEWKAAPEYQWFFDKYADSGIELSDFSDSTKVVKTWLLKMGPHNDLPEAKDDFKAALDWLLTPSEDEKARTNPRALRKRANLITELNLELSELSEDNSESISYLNEAIENLEETYQAKSNGELVGSDVTIFMQLCSAKMELARRQILGTPALTSEYTPEQYTQLDRATDEQLVALGQYFSSIIASTEQRYLQLIQPFPSGDVQTTKNQESEYRRTVGSLFEIYTYLNVMEHIKGHKGLAVERFRPGFSREEESLAHKYDETPGSNKNAAKLNFDFRYDTLNDNFGSGQSKGLYRTVYYQTKLTSTYVKAEIAEFVNQQFFGGKEFRFLYPKDLQQDPTQLLSLDECNNFVKTMKEWISSTQEPKAR